MKTGIYLLLLACMLCMAQTPQANAQNAICNPGFESGTLPWIYWMNGPALVKTTSPGFVGAHAAKLTVSRAGSNVQLFQPFLTLEPNTQYRLTFAACSSAGHDMEVYVQNQWPPYTNYGLSFFANLTSSWQTFQVTFTTQNFTRTTHEAKLMFWISQYASSGDIYYIDDVVIQKLNDPIIVSNPFDVTVEVGQRAPFAVTASGSAPLAYQWQKNAANIGGATAAQYLAPPAVSADNGAMFRCVVSNPQGTVNSSAARLTVLTDNLIHNGTFEDGTLNWLYYMPNRISFTTPPVSGRGGLVAKVTINQADTNMQLYQPYVTLAAGGHYRLTFDAMASSGQNMLVSFLQHTPPFTNYGLERLVDLTTSWASYSYEFVATGFTGTTNNARLRFYFVYLSGNGDMYWIDNVVLTRLPAAMAEPPGAAANQATQSLQPLSFSLGQNYPNPFNPTTTIRFQIPNPGHVSLKVFDMLGRQVTTLVDEERAPGMYEEVLDAGKLSSGVYIYRLQAGDQVATKRLTLLR